MSPKLAMLLFWVLIYLQFRKARSQTQCNPSTRFTCKNGICVSKAKVCDGNQDCSQGEDEENCPTIPPDYCYPRNVTMAYLNGYGVCRKACTPAIGCTAPRKRCLCDDECGYSCINKFSVCLGSPPTVMNSSDTKITQKDGTLPAPSTYLGATAIYECSKGMRLRGPLPRCNGRKLWSEEIPRCVDISCREPVPLVANSSSHRFLRPKNNNFAPVQEGELPSINDIAEYQCDNGLLRLGNPPRCGENIRWTTHSIRCIVPCFENRNVLLIQRNNLTCGSDCDTSADCSNGKECYCDAVCGRICANPDTDCGRAQEVSHATLKYTGLGVRKMARYSCREGYYLRSGSLSLRCSSTRIWIGELPVCGDIQCGDPGPSIRATGGVIYSYDGLYFGATVEFKCRSNYRLLGSRYRTCLGDGKWSGHLTVCDHRDKLVRCRHPGIPINGEMIVVSGENFAVNSTVRFTCERQYVLVGDEEQTCLFFKQWSGYSTPLCVDPRYPNTAPDVINTLSRSLGNLPKREVTLGRALHSHETDKEHEVYFMFDISDSVLKSVNDLKDETHFAKRFVQRMEGFEGVIKYGIMVFASKNYTVLDITEERRQTTKDVFDALDRVYNKAMNKTYKNSTRGGTDTSIALDKLKDTMAFMNKSKEYANDEGVVKEVKRHVFIFTDGKHTEGSDPVNKRELIEKEFKPGIEFYCITACDKCHVSDFKELVGLASYGENQKKNYIFINDFYRLSEYLDQVTNLTIDFSKCGQAGDVGSIKKQASLARVAGGKDATDSAWPWQVLITKKSYSETKSTFDEVVGGGSILNRKWILTAAHLFPGKTNNPLRWIVTAGIFQRPLKGRSPKSSVQMFQPKRIHRHPNYTVEFPNDIALIELGKRLDPKALGSDSNLPSSMVYTYYVRPVCLPCSGTCLQRSQLTDSDGNSLIKEDMTEEEICREEEKVLIDRHEKTVVTGFGHYTRTEDPFYHASISRNLKQALLEIQSENLCEAGITEINNRTTERYTLLDSMFCCKSLNSDACTGDSGGPLVREVVKDNFESCWVQIGIVSFGYGCQSGDIPGYYTNVARFIPWIRSIAGNETVPIP